MSEPIEIRVRTITPLWTGGVGGTSDRLHATGIIGSLRWWYEVIVRGLGGYVSDPAADNASERSDFATKAYEEAKRNGASESSALQIGLKPLCVVSYLFGTTGWARLFQLQILEAPSTPLHFRTGLPMNGNWLKRVFGGETGNIDRIKVPYGVIRLRLVPRGHDADFALRQIALALHMAADYGGLGARLQHGFGQVELEFSEPYQSMHIADSLETLATRLSTWARDGRQNEIPFDLRNFVSMTYDIPANALSSFTRAKAHVGTSQKNSETAYLPCAFDLRYKGGGSWGMRRWLKEQRNWQESDNAKQLGALDELMGPRSQWGRRDNVKFIADELRTASRVFFSMPYLVSNDTYRLRIFGFAPPQLLTPEELSSLCHEYMDHVLYISPRSTVLGKDLIPRLEGVSP